MIHLLGRGQQQQRSFPKALKFFVLAAQRGNLFAMHKLAHMHLRGLGSPADCNAAVHMFKAVAERVHSGWQLLHSADAQYQAGDVELAAALYTRAAEQGYVEAQMNAAWLCVAAAR